MKKHEDHRPSLAEMLDPPKSDRAEKVKVVAKTIAGGIAISAAYLGIIAVLMSPAFDVVPPA